MELPSIGWFAVPVLLWVASGLATLIVLRRAHTSRLILRLAAVFLVLWAVLATTALAWLIANGGWPALAGLAQRPPAVFGLSAFWLWIVGGVGALGVLSVAFLVNQLVGRSILRICAPQPLPWPSSLGVVAGRVELLRFQSPSAEAFSFTLLERRAAHWRCREVILVSHTLWLELEPEEREAVVAHELAHVLELDSRYLTFFRTLAKLMRWDPVLGYLANRLTHREEFRADDDAVAATHRPLALARALFKAIMLGRESLGRTSANFLGVGGRRGRQEAVERIRRLMALADQSPAHEADRA